MNQKPGTPGNLAPKLFGDERHDRMQEYETLIDNPGHCCAGFGYDIVITFREKRLRELDIPVAHATPDMRIQAIRRVVEPVLGKSQIHRLSNSRGFADDPFVDRLPYG